MGLPYNYSVNEDQNHDQARLRLNPRPIPYSILIPLYSVDSVPGPIGNFRRFDRIRFGYSFYTQPTLSVVVIKRKVKYF